MVFFVLPFLIFDIRFYFILLHARAVNWRRGTGNSTRYSIIRRVNHDWALGARIIFYIRCF